jgi:hypothetical protein
VFKALANAPNPDPRGSEIIWLSLDLAGSSSGKTNEIIR